MAFQRKAPKGAPVLRGFLTDDGTQIRVHCPYCDRIHLHGWPAGTPSWSVEHRSAHCIPDTPFRHGGYYIALYKEQDLPVSRRTKGGAAR